MASITTRAGKGSPLTNAEIDANFTDLNAELGGKLSLAGGTMTGAITFAAGQTWPTFNQNTTGSAASLTTGRTIGMTGDVTWTSGSFNGTANVTGTATLSASGVTAGTYGSAVNIPQITVDAKGRLTDVSNVAVSIPSGSLTFTGDVTGTGSTGSSTTLTLADSGVTAGTYTKVTVDAKGRATTGASLSSSDVTTALGYTPYNSTNPSGYITSSGSISGNAATATNAQGATFTTAGNASWGGRVQLGGNGGASGVATLAVVQATDGNLHLDPGSGKSTYLNYYTNGVIYLNGTTYSISSNGSYYNGTAAAANSVAWSNVSGRPTAVSSFSNDSGYITSSALSSYLALSGGTVTGSLTVNDRVIVGAGQNSSWLEMRDNDEGVRYLHNNSSTLGFVANDGNWSFRITDAGDMWLRNRGWFSDIVMRKDITQTMFSGQGSALAFENQSSFFRFAFNEVRFYDWNNGQDILTLNGNISTPNYFVGRWDSSGRNYSREWIEFPNYTGLYSPLNGAHFYPNDSSYGAWLVRGSRNGWRGLEFEDGLQLMMNYNAHGIHRSDTGWMFYSESRNLYIPGQVQAGWSDTRLKDNQQRVDRSDVFGTLSQFRAHRFNWNAKATELGYDVQVGDEEIGLIAQHVKAALPVAAAVNKAGAKPGDDGSFDYLTIRWDKITPFTVEAVNIHEEDIASLKEKVARLEALVETLIGD